jgi:hypothetical protein
MAVCSKRHYQHIIKIYIPLTYDSSFNHLLIHLEINSNSTIYLYIVEKLKLVSSITYNSEYYE